MIFSSTVISPNEQAFSAAKSAGLFDIATSKKDCANAMKLSFLLRSLFHIIVIKAQIDCL